MRRIRTEAGRIRGRWREVPRFHQLMLGLAMVLGIGVVVAYALAIRPNTLGGDQIEYDIEGRFFAEGKWWWSTIVLGEPHPTAWKSPIYPAWVGLWYELLGPGATKLALVQAVTLAPATVGLTWLLARRWFDLPTASLAAVVVALFPLSWEFFGLLYSEALAIPLTLVIIYLVVDRPPPGWGWIATVGALVGALMLVRPTSGFIFALIAISWTLALGWRRAAGATALAVGCAVLVIAPWTIRNAVELDGFVPISIQDAAAYGTFNDEAANDPVYPYAWRPTPENVVAELEADPPRSEIEFRSRLQQRARSYIREHPGSVPKAFFWNGVVRLWDLRRPSLALDETNFDGRSRTVTGIGLGMYYVLLPLALLGLWRARNRPQLWAPLLAGAAALALVFTIQGGTRYRAPIEPIIVVLACSNLALLTGSRRGGASGRQATG